MTEIADRKKAIKYALENAKKDDIILITGLGHEQFRVSKWQKIPMERRRSRKRLNYCVGFLPYYAIHSVLNVI